eukprot:469755-Hanusia_phi.AAC.1
MRPRRRMQRAPRGGLQRGSGLGPRRGSRARRAAFAELGLSIAVSLSPSHGTVHRDPGPGAPGPGPGGAAALRVRLGACQSGAPSLSGSERRKGRARRASSSGGCCQEPGCTGLTHGSRLPPGAACRGAGHSDRASVTKLQHPVPRRRTQPDRGHGPGVRCRRDGVTTVIGLSPDRARRAAAAVRRLPLSRPYRLRDWICGGRWLR